MPITFEFLLIIVQWPSLVSQRVNETEHTSHHSASPISSGRSCMITLLRVKSGLRLEICQRRINNADLVRLGEVSRMFVE